MEIYKFHTYKEKHTEFKTLEDKKCIDFMHYVEKKNMWRSGPKPFHLLEEETLPYVAGHVCVGFCEKVDEKYKQKWLESYTWNVK